jgi:CubicO group peptidase (beta-lactamase class C family)
VPYERFVEERFLAPLGLGRTTWARTEPAARCYFVDPYSGVLRAEGEIDRSGGVSAAGDLWSTTGDLCRWGAWLREQEPMHAVQVMADPHQWLLAWGLGLQLHRRGDRILYGHGGAMPGFLAALVCSRDEDAQVCVLTNGSTPGAAVEALAVALVERAIELHPRERSLWRPEQTPPPEVEELLGPWWTEGEQIVLSWSEGRLGARLVGASARVKPSVLEQFEPDRYRIVSGRERGERLDVVRDENGGIERLVMATYPLTRTPEVFGPTT